MGCIPYTKNSLSIPKNEDPENNNKEKRTGDNQEEHNVIQISSSKYPQSTSYQNKDSNIIILKPMPRQSELSQKFDSIESDKKIIRSSSSNKFENENNKLSNVIKVKKKINSSMNLLKNLEVNNLDSQKALPSLNKQSQLNNNNMIEILPCFEETMYDVWIEKDKEIKIVIIGNWGIEEKGSTNENGYDGLVNGYNLCSLLYRIGTDTQYQKLTHKDEQARYILKSDIEGPLFFKMNITIAENIIKKKGEKLTTINKLTQTTVPTIRSKFSKLAEKLGISMQDTVAIGDSTNDLTMLEAAGTSIAMGNSTKQILDMADYVTTDIYEDGIFHALQWLGVLEEQAK